MMIHGRNSFDQLVNIRTYDNIRKITTGTGDDYTTNCLLYYTNFKVHYKLIAIDLIKRQPLNLDPKTHKYISQEIQNLSGTHQNCFLSKKKSSKLTYNIKIKICDKTCNRTDFEIIIKNVWR